MKIKIFQKETFFYKISRSIFRVSFVTFLVLFLLEYIEPGFVTNWFNPVWVLIISLISGIIVIAKK